MYEDQKPDGDDVLLIQFAKWPRLGRVKTRLAAALGEEGALAAHLRLTLTVLANLRATGRPLQFFWDSVVTSPPPAAGTVLAALERHRIPQRIQQGQDLGTRMTRALEQGLREYSQVIIVGSDCPSVDADYIASAVSALSRSDVVLGPSDDGGYVLLGARATHPDMLAGITWGTAQVCEATAAQLARSGLSHELLATRWDVDEPEDWARFLAAHP